MPRPRGDNDLVVKLSNSKLLLVVLVDIRRLLMLQKRLIAMHAVKNFCLNATFFEKGSDRGRLNVSVMGL